MNPLLSILGGGGGQNNFTQIMMKAVGAAMRGDSPEDFLKGIAKTDPRLQGLDLNNLEQTAHTLAEQRGVDEEQLTAQLKDTVNKFM